MRRPRTRTSRWPLSLAGSLLCSIGLSPAFAQHGPGYEPPEYHDGQTHYERTDEKFGRFTVTRYIEDCRAVPIMHSCWLTKEARLEWHDRSNTIGFAIVDNGWSVRFRPDGKSADGRTVCIAQGVLMGYTSKPNIAETWANLQLFIRQNLQGCSAVRAADLQRAIADLRSSQDDYAAAAKAWKAVAVELLGSGGRRCIAERVVKPILFVPQFECTAYSQP